MLPLLMLTLVSLKSVHTLFDTYLGLIEVKFKQIRVMSNIQFLAVWQKMVNHFQESVDSILEDVSMSKIPSSY